MTKKRLEGGVRAIAPAGWVARLTDKGRDEYDLAYSCLAGAVTMRWSRPNFNSKSEIQDDHFRRFADLAFLHLGGAWEQNQLAEPHSWVTRVDNSDERFGRGEYLAGLSSFHVCQSGEYTQSCASIIFSHTWICSAANYYLGREKRGEEQGKHRVEHSDSPAAIVSDLQCGRDSDMHSAAVLLGDYRNALLHLKVEDTRKKGLSSIGFPIAYEMAHCAWIVYEAILRNYSYVPDEGSWSIQTTRYGLPETWPL